MKKILLLSILALSLVSACGDDTTGNENNASANSATNNGTTANNTTTDADPTWTLSVDGQDLTSGAATSLIRLGANRVQVQFVSMAGNGQITIEELAADGLGTYAETVTTQFTGFAGAANCGFSSNGDGTAPPLEIVITENAGTKFHATFTFTDLGCVDTAGGELPAISGSGEITKG